MDWTRADELFHLVAICIAGSIIAHSSTDVLVARWLSGREDEAKKLPRSRARGRGPLTDHP